MSEPGWRRNGRNGPFDWWLSCEQHAYDYQRGCMSCGMAEDHNIEFQAKLDRERVGINGLTEAETSATASVMGIVGTTGEKGDGNG